MRFGFSNLAWATISVSCSEKKKTADAPLAQGSFNSFGLSPLSLTSNVVEVKTSPSTRVTNTNNSKTLVTILPIGLVPADGTLRTMPLATLPETNLSRNITIETPEVDVPENSYKDVSLSINVPAGLTGTQYAGVTAVKTNSQILGELDVDRKDEFTKTVGVGMQPAIGVTVKCHIKTR